MDQREFDASVQREIRRMVAQGEAEAVIEDARKMPPPTVERQRCWLCGGDGWLDDGEFDKPVDMTCWVCKGTGMAMYEVRR